MEITYYSLGKKAKTVSDVNTFYQMIPEEIEITKDTEFIFHKHTIKEGRNIIEKIEVEHEIIKLNGFNFVLIHNYFDLLKKHIDFLFEIKTKIK